MCSKGTNLFCCAVLLCLLSCVHHSHQEGNLSLDVTQDHNHENDSDDHVTEDNDHDHDHDHHHDPHVRPLVNDYRVWLASSVSIFVISLCGVFGVLVIPITQKIFYQHLIQFLVALAVGTLSGDALLHLIPHALMANLPMDEKVHHDFHQTAVWRGFAALLSLLIFFFFEKMINILGEWRETKRRTKEKKVRVVRSGHKTSDRAVGERVCKHKYSSYCVADIDFNDESKRNDDEIVAVEGGGGGVAMTATTPTSTTVVRPLLAPALSDSCLNTSETNKKWRNDEIAKNSANGYDTVFVREHEHVHHGHSHAHSHLHSAPDSISSVAWMVVFGDGIHNIADGMAIGAAFTESYMSGLSTTIAVLCHELPHEIGDFAMLLKAGMSVKQAIFYNILSSVLSFMGMIGGILLGNLEDVTPWIFMATAGIFLYVALVDMIPELNSGHAHPYTRDTQQESRFTELVLQLLGLLTGAGIMLMIALFEHDLKEAFV